MIQACISDVTTITGEKLYFVNDPPEAGAIVRFVDLNEADYAKFKRISDEWLDMNDKLIELIEPLVTTP